MIQNKKGISPIIATVVIVMLTLTAVAIIAGIVVPFVRDSLEESTECTDYQGFYSFEESLGYNCYDSNDLLYKISIKSGFDENLVDDQGNVVATISLTDNIGGMKIVLNREDGTTKILDINGSSTCNQPDENICILRAPIPGIVRLPGAGGVITYSYNAGEAGAFTSAEVYPVLKNGRICADFKESIGIKQC